MEPRTHSGSLPQELFQQVVEAAPNAMVMVDRQGRIVLVNSQTEKLFAYAREELYGKSIETLVPERFRGGHQGYRAAYYDELQPRPMGSGRDLYGRRKDGSEFPVEIGLNPMRTSEEVFVLAAIADITQRKHAEHEFMRKTEELARSNRDLEQFAYVASHDLQEPLRAVAGPLQLLRAVIKASWTLVPTSSLRTRWMVRRGCKSSSTTCSPIRAWLEPAPCSN